MFHFDTMRPMTKWLLFWLPATVALLFTRIAFAQDVPLPEGGGVSLLETLLAQAGPWLALAGAALVASLVGVARSKTVKAILSKVHSAALSSLFQAMAHAAFDFVLAMNQTLKEELQKALEDGEITEDEYRAGLAKLKAKAVDHLKELFLGKLLGLGVSPVLAATHIDAVAESAVKKAKALDPSKASISG